MMNDRACEQIMIECFRKVRDGVKKIEQEVEDLKVTAYKMGDLIRIDVKLPKEDQV